MKAALIPPINHLQIASGRAFHLTLAHLYEYPFYAGFYRAEREMGSYVILDNSAHEFKIGQPMEKLSAVAEQVYPNEIVVPDVLFDADATVDSAKTALAYLSTWGSEVMQRNPQPRLMFVPQGENLFLVDACLMSLLDLYAKIQAANPVSFPYPPVIGVSKDYEVFKGGMYTLLSETIIPIADQVRAEIHMLGWGRKLLELGRISRDFGDRIRSIDSARPFVYATKGIYLDLDSVPKYPGRDPDYFECVLDDVQMRAALHNVQIFEFLAGEGGQNEWVTLPRRDES